MSDNQDSNIPNPSESTLPPAAVKPVLPDKHESSAAKALHMLRIELRYNLRSQLPEIFQLSSDDVFPRAPVQQWLELTDRMEARLRDLIAERFTYKTVRDGPQPMHFAKERWGMVINAHLCTRERDPFLDWLSDLPPWDKSPRLDVYLNDLFSAGDDPLVKWVGQFLFLGPVHRAYEPGAKLDEMPILVGLQGIGKSALLRSMFPVEHSTWFNDGLHLAADPKIRAEALQGRVIVEVSEMAGSNRVDLESLKAFVSRQDDGAVRLSFRHNPERALRRCVIIGTTNRLDSLPNDPSGNRRFVPIALHKPTQAVEDYLAIHRDQLWAEALVRHAAGVNPRMPRTLMPDAAVAAEAHRNRDTTLEDALDALPPGWEGTLAEMAQKISLIDAGVRLSRRDQYRLGTALTVRGYVKTQVMTGGVRRRVWSLPVTSP